MAVSICASLTNPARVGTKAQDTAAHINESSMHGTPGFPVAIYDDDITNDFVNWHWHEEFEVGFVTHGTILLECGSRKYTLHCGDIFFINSNVLHSMYNGSLSKKAALKAIIFHGSVVGGKENSVFHKKYLLPILNSNHFKDIILRENDNHYQSVFALLNEIWDSVFSEIPDYEMIVRNAISDLFRILKHFPENNIQIPSGHNYLQESRVQVILTYIHQHYAENFSLDDLAREAAVSKSEVLRCFKSIIGQSPIKYLKIYRLQSAAYMIKETTYSIGTICELCGFEDNSYFSKSFKEMYHCTPREYRMVCVPERIREI